MLVARSNRYVLNNHKEGEEEEEEETLARMAKDGNQIEDVEEGEISDSASVEEITEEDFNNQEARVSKELSKPKGEARVWTMQDLYKYPMCRGYSTGLYNFAWAQAVQNKPLNEIFVMDVEPDESSKRSSSSTVSSLGNGKEDKNVMTSKEVTKVIIDDSGDEMDVKMEDVGGGEKEEGELEEGEIDLDSEPVEKAAQEGEERVLNNSLSVSQSEIDLKEGELEKRVNSLRQALGTITVTEAENSFEGVCSRLQISLESLQEVVLENCVPSKDALVQLSYTTIQSVNSVFCSMSHNQKEQNKVIFLRLLSVVMSQDPPLFSCEQMKEIAVMMSSLDSPAVLSSTDVSNKQKDKPVTDGVNLNDSDALAENAGHDLNSSKKFLLDSLNVGPFLDKNEPIMLPEAMKPGLFSFRGRGVLAPLLDLHKDHDADSLPSPTQGTTPFLPVHKALAVGDGVAKPELATNRAAHELEDSTMHPYETEALKAVSTYQQKFGRTSFFLQDRLPSPTPSGECDDGDGDTSGEVSSSSTVGNVKTVNPPIFTRPIVSSAPHVDGSSAQGLISARIAGPVSSGSNPTLKTSAKSRDPRLQFANADVGALDLNHRPLPVVFNAPKVEPLGGIISSRKHKTVEEPILDGPALKRQRNGLTNSDVVMDVKIVSGSGGWLEDTGTVGPQIMNRNQLVENTGNNPRKMETGVSCPSTATVKPNLTTSGNEQVPLKGVSTPASLPALFNDIAVNPTILLNLLQMEQQQRLEAEVQWMSGDPANTTMHPPSSNSILGAVPLGNVAPINPSGLGQKPTGTLQVPSQMTPMNLQDDMGKIRMKPRDPRRILHSNTFQKSGSLGSEQFKTNGVPTLSTQGSKDNVNAQKLEDQADRKSMPSQPIAPPDIARLFTKNLKNIADILSITQPSTTLPVASQIVSSQQVQVNSDRVDVKAIVSDSDEQRTGTGSTPEEGAAGTSQPPNAWGDVEHLLEGFDDQQKAAIQRERARRIGEQKKMFAARKLCLVLDLDHTLLNSAKFMEVDPVHDEILRKKEEQDREKPQRHLFRFPHMGMWTKLRPGIWNFLEKASNLYELHLYTMGNKLYATEMAKVLDPTGALFAGRVISRGDDGDLIDGDERVPKSKDLEGVLGMESAVVLIDDSVRVWPHNKLNLIVVERYTYFPCSRRQFGLPGPSLLEIDHDERPEDGTLASSLAVIERIHEDFFSHQALDEVDVRNILASEQQKILAGCRIVFSRVFPVGEANPHLHPLWQTAEQFGAVCTTQIDEQVTHVVANSLGTDKVNWALSTGRYVVHPGWVEASALLYRRANEQDFAIKP